MLCKSCGTDLTATQNFCGSCGIRVNDSSLFSGAKSSDLSWGIFALNLLGMLLVAAATYPIRSEPEGPKSIGYLFLRMGVPSFLAAVVVGIFFVMRRRQETNRVRRSFIIGTWVFLGLVVLGERSGPTQAPAREVIARSLPHQQAPAQAELLPYERRAWSGNAFDQFDSVQAVEARARSIPQINEKRAWAAVVAWQAYFMGSGGREANVALYMGVDSVLEGLRSNSGICRPGEITTVEVAHATQSLPAGSQIATYDCEK